MLEPLAAELGLQRLQGFEQGQGRSKALALGRAASNPSGGCHHHGPIEVRRLAGGPAHRFGAKQRRPVQRWSRLGWGAVGAKPSNQGLREQGPHRDQGGGGIAQVGAEGNRDAARPLPRCHGLISETGVHSSGVGLFHGCKRSGSALVSAGGHYWPRHPQVGAPFGRRGSGPGWGGDRWRPRHR